MRGFLRQFVQSNGGASSAEFAIVLPLFLVLLFGVIDAGRFMWEVNKAEKATQVGARTAVVTNVLSPGFRDEDYAGDTVDGETIGPGERIPAGALGTIKCTETSCTCEDAPCPADLGTMDSATFNNTLVARMKAIYPAIEAKNVEVRYSGSGVGFAGSLAAGGGGGGGAAAPEQIEIEPLVTVTLKDLQFRPITSLLFATIAMPDFSTTLTAEDSSGAYSN